MASQVPPLETLIRLEAGLKAELGVLRASSERDILEDAVERYEFCLPDAQLEALKKAREVLTEDLAIHTRRLKRRMRMVRDITEGERKDRRSEEEEQEPTKEEDLRKELYGLRRRVLMFAKEQWPLSQDSDQFEGGDFWDACVAACGGPERPIEYSSRETGFAELLLQTGIADRAEDLGSRKRIKFVKEIFQYEGS